MRKAPPDLSMPETLARTDLPNLVHRGKVRDIYDLGGNLLFVATDRISAFDVVLRQGIPEKGVVLNEMSRFWFERTAHIVPHHFIAMGYARAQVGPRSLPPEIARRSMVVRRAEPVLAECVVRGYLAGSGWAEYQRSGTVGGAVAPVGLVESSRLPDSLFTPTTKAQASHDEPISESEMGAMIGEGLTAELKRLSLELYSFAHGYALARNVIIADTKFEFGVVDGQVLLIDEVLTPDSSRFWSVDDYEPGRPQRSLDKQIVRDWLSASGWDREPPPPDLPREVISQTAQRYKDVYTRLSGLALPSAG